MTDHGGTAQPAFTNETFALLAGIAATPTAGFYLDHKLDLKVHVEQPLQRLMLGASARLPAVFRERMETERGLFSRFLKNDFGRGGAWSHYWGAFYPKGSRRLADVQLAVGIHADLLQVSFYIGDYAPQQRVRFLRNLNRHRRLLPDLLHELIADPRVLLARGGTRFDENGQAVGLEPLTWQEWLSDPSTTDFWLRAAFSPKQVLSLPAAVLEAQVAELHRAYFPLALLAMDDEPVEQIEAYWL